MENYIESPLCNSLRFVPVNLNRDIRYNMVHFDDGWFKEQVKYYEDKKEYYAPWQVNDTVPLQFRSTVGPVKLYIIRCDGKFIVSDVTVPLVSTSITGQPYQHYQVSIDFSTILDDDPLPPGIYFVYIVAGTDSTKAELLSEPIDLRTNHPKTLLHRYKHSKNDFGVAWETGIEMCFRVESSLMELQPKRERNVYNDQLKNITTLRSIPYRKWKIKYGENKGVAPWVADLLNFIYCLDEIYIDGKLMAPDEGAEIETQYQNGYPLVLLSCDMREGRNNYSNRVFTQDAANRKVVFVYNINDWTYFGSVNGTPTVGPAVITK